MRTTVEINNLIKLTQSYLDNKTNQYKGERQNYIEKWKKSTSEKLFPELLQESSKTVNNTESKPNLSSQNPCAKSSYSLNVASGFPLASPVHTTPVCSEERIDQDELYKLMSRSRKKNKKNLQTVVTKYCYTCDSEIRHSINGPLPKLVKLSKHADPCEQIVLMALLLL